MITLLIVLVSLVAYFAVGWFIAASAIPALWVRARKSWHSDDYARGAVVSGVVTRTLFWPALGPYELLARRIDAQDPKEVERRQREMKQRIAELERELGMNR